MTLSIHRRILTTTLCWVIGLSVLGCQSDGPEFAGGDSRIIEGTLEPEESSTTHFFALTRSGTVSILASTIEGRDPETEEPVDTPRLAFSVGAPRAEDETQCQSTFSKILAEGESYSVYFTDGAYCIVVFRTFDALTTTRYTYVIELSGAFS